MFTSIMAVVVVLCCTVVVLDKNIIESRWVELSVVTCPVNDIRYLWTTCGWWNYPAIGVIVRKVVQNRSLVDATSCLSTYFWYFKLALSKPWSGLLTNETLDQNTLTPKISGIQLSGSGKNRTHFFQLINGTLL
jgi:hypothetical protein